MAILLYASLLGFLYFYISLTVIKGRRSNKVSLGPGSDNEILHLTSAHNNFASYVPLFLIMLYILEVNGAYSVLIHSLGVAFLAGRILHFLSMKNQEKTFEKRVLGMKLTLWPLIISSGCCFILYIKPLLS